MGNPILLWHVTYHAIIMLVMASPTKKSSFCSTKSVLEMLSKGCSSIIATLEQYTFWLNVFGPTIVFYLEVTLSTYFFALFCFSLNDVIQVRL